MGYARTQHDWRAATRRFASGFRSSTAGGGGRLPLEHADLLYWYSAEFFFLKLKGLYGWSMAPAEARIRLQARSTVRDQAVERLMLNSGHVSLVPAMTHMLATWVHYPRRDHDEWPACDALGLPLGIGLHAADTAAHLRVLPSIARVLREARKHL